MNGAALLGGDAMGLLDMIAGSSVLVISHSTSNP
jgi:hypothetical protein